MKTKWSTGKIVAVVLAVIFALLIVSLAVFISLFLIFRMAFQSDNFNSVLKSFDGDTSNNIEEKDDKEKETEEESEEGTEETEEEYYTDWKDCIRDDLAYSIEWDTYEINEKDNPLHLTINYPIVKSEELTNVKYINDAIQNEIEVLDKYLNTVKPYLEEGAEYEFTAQAYVTYMDEEKLSIVFIEKGDCAGTLENYLVTNNFNMNNGMAIPNNDLFTLDKNFVIDFRNRSNKQNGVDEGLDAMTDQEVEYYLSQSNSLVAFYTPLGIEIGFNYPDGWVTVTYKDYKKNQSYS